MVVLEFRLDMLTSTYLTYGIFDGNMQIAPTEILPTDEDIFVALPKGGNYAVQQIFFFQ